MFINQSVKEMKVVYVNFCEAELSVCFL